MTQIDRDKRIIAVEGLDGVGKTTVSRLICEQTDSTYLPYKEINPLAGLRGLYDAGPVSTRFLYHLTSNMMNYFLIKRAYKEATGDLLVDRTVYSTLAYHLASGMSPTWQKFVMPQITDQFDMLLYLTASEQERMRRLRKNRPIIGACDPLAVDFGKRTDFVYRRLAPEKTYVFDTTNKTPEQVASGVIGRLFE